VGFYTLLASVLAGEAGHVYSFEPLAANAAILRRHLEMNRIRNCTVFQEAVAASDGTARFDPSSSGDLAHLSETGTETVKTVALDSLFAVGQLRAPRVVKIDVEGAELEALRGAVRLMEAHRPVILLATHGAEVHAGCGETPVRPRIPLGVPYGGSYGDLCGDFGASAMTSLAPAE
jgi:FkbM family methyltransferase